MIAIKKDFVNEDELSYCRGQRLSSGKAYFLKDSDGVIHYAGKHCAENHATNDLSLIPDLTRSLLARKSGSSVSKLSGTRERLSLDTSKSDAITYLMLRQDKLAAYQLADYKTKDGTIKVDERYSMTYGVLDRYYQTYLNEGGLSDKAAVHILRIENSMSSNCKLLSLKNLRTCYAYDYYLGRVISSLNKEKNQVGVNLITNLLEGINGLRSRSHLSIKQIEAIPKFTKWLSKELRESKLHAFDL